MRTTLFVTTTVTFVNVAQAINIQMNNNIKNKMSGKMIQTFSEDDNLDDLHDHKDLTAHKN